MLKHLETKFTLTKGSLREKKEDGGEFGYFEGYASTFGNIDRTDDVVVSGAFHRCISKGKLIKMLWQHQRLVYAIHFSLMKP